MSTLLGLSIRIPDHSTLSRRSKKLEALCACSVDPGGPVHLLIDSTGLRVHSGNEPRDIKRNRRGWRKLHLAVDAETGEILASELTKHRARDSSQVPGLLNQIAGDLASMMADSAYDATRVYEAIEKRPSGNSTRVVSPPRRNARLNGETAPSQRNHNVRGIREVGRRRWEKASGYSRRSLVETAIARYKTIIGRRLRSRYLSNQRTEARLRAPS